MIKQGYATYFSTRSSYFHNFWYYLQSISRGAHACFVAGHQWWQATYCCHPLALSPVTPTFKAVRCHSFFASAITNNKVRYLDVSSSPWTQLLRSADKLGMLILIPQNGILAKHNQQQILVASYIFLESARGSNSILRDTWNSTQLSERRIISRWPRARSHFLRLTPFSC